MRIEVTPCGAPTELDRIKVTLIGAPNEHDWLEVKRRACVTAWKRPKTMPDSEWRHKILEARHTPIRRLMYSFLIEGIPSNIATHFARHVHAQPYISSLRNDRQSFTDGDKAPRDTPVNMIIDINAEELQVMANKRLCNKAAKTTREVMMRMCVAAIDATPELDGLLVPLCVYCGGKCHEMVSCREDMMV